MTLFNLYMIILLFLNQNILSVWSNNALSNISYDRTDLPYPLHPNITVVILRYTVTPLGR